MTDGSRSAIAINPSMKLDCVISQASHSNTTRCAQVPTAEAALPARYTRRRALPSGEAAFGKRKLAPWHAAASGLQSLVDP